MKNMKRNIVLLGVLFIATLFLVLTLLFLHIDRADEPRVLSVKAYSNDNCIDLVWQSIGSRPKYNIELTIASTDSSEVIRLASNVTNYTFSTGTHGTLYTFSVALKHADTVMGDACSTSAVFLDYSQLPDLPTLRIVTENEVIPSCVTVNAPEGCWGTSITDNEYVRAQFNLNGIDDNKIHALGQIRIRGNTSALGRKKPYKIELERPMDLLDLGESYADKDWVLLPYDYSLGVISSLKVSELCGIEYQPRSFPVTVFMNGDYLGCYLLIESVKRSPQRVNISDSGFLIENDAYWWNGEINYFKTPHQTKELAYTVKYPKETSKTEDGFSWIYEYIVAYESALLENNGDYTAYIDLESFAAWLLAQDILGNWDAGGSNMFLYKYDMNPTNLLKIGPLWDFTAVFQTKDTWSSIHNSSNLHYDVLLHDERFADVYKSQWDALADTLCEDIRIYLSNYVHEYGTALQESLELEIARYPGHAFSHYQICDAYNDVLLWFETRVNWLNYSVPLL